MPVNDAIHPLQDAFGQRLLTGVVLAPYTTFRIGGPARWYLEVESADELARAVTLARQSGVPWFLLGQGANILVADAGFPGLVIRNTADAARVDGAFLWAESGASVYPDLINLAVDAGLSGLEHFVGIPSTVGGALWQNLHFLSPDRQRTVFVAEVFDEAEVLTADGQRRRVDRDYFRFGYDYSVLHDTRDVVLSVRFGLEPASQSVMRETMAANLRWRGERHPPLDSEPSAGSIFKKIEGVGAGRLIDECGLKGLCRGGAQISPRHANIVINRGGASAADVCALIAHARQVVRRQKGITLEPEIRFVGDFGADMPVDIAGVTT